MKDNLHNAAVDTALGTTSVIQVALRSAVECLVQSFLIILLGGVALNMVGGIWKAMTPSAPPLLSDPTELEAPEPGTGGSSGMMGPWLHDHRFALVFACLFVPTLFGRLGILASSPSTLRLRKLHQRIASDWFSLIVLNAIGASISAILISWTHEISSAKFLLATGLALCETNLRPILSLFGTPPDGWLQQWSHWYSLNALKLSFWILYLSAILDDLGLPNLKTLARRAIRQARGRWE